MTRLLRLLPLPLLFFASVGAWAKPAHYALDPVHTRVMFAISHAGFSKALGTVSGSSGTLLFDPDDWTAAKLDVRVPIDRADLGDAGWNKAVLAHGLLDAKDYPVATFVSTRIEPVDAQRAAVYGDLTLHGTTREVKLDVVFNQLKRHPLPPFRRTAGFSATATLSRADFGITAWKSVIGDEVELRLEVEAVRAHGGGQDAGDAADDSADDDDASDAPAQETEPDATPASPSAEPEPTP